MVIIDWKGGQYRQSCCPVCGSAGSKQRLLDIKGDHRGESVLSTDVVAFLRCPSCEVRYCDPLRSVDYETGDSEGLKYYLEQGAGIDVMLEPLSLVDRRPIKRYLEIGCSFGFAMDYARRMLGWQVRGFDPGFIAVTGKELLDLPIDNAYFDAASVGEEEGIWCCAQRSSSTFLIQTILSRFCGARLARTVCCCLPALSGDVAGHPCHRHLTRRRLCLSAAQGARQCRPLQGGGRHPSPPPRWLSSAIQPRYRAY